MVPDKRLIEAVGSKWKWMLHCWFLRESVQDLADSIRALEKERDTAHLLKLELDDLKAKMEKEAEAHKLSRDGNLALLRFIHTGHRLNVKFDADSIRGALRRANGG